MKKIVISFMVSALLISFSSCGGNENPGMEEFMAAFGNKDKLKQVALKYSNAGVVPDALFACQMVNPVIKNKEKKGSVTLYSAEATVGDCDERSENAKGTVRLFTISWEKNKITTFSWGGPKSGKVEY